MSIWVLIHLVNHLRKQWQRLLTKLHECKDRDMFLKDAITIKGNYATCIVWLMVKIDVRKCTCTYKDMSNSCLALGCHFPLYQIASFVSTNFLYISYFLYIFVDDKWWMHLVKKFNVYWGEYGHTSEVNCDPFWQSNHMVSLKNYV